MTIDVKEAEHVAMFSDTPLRDLLTECLAALACRQPFGMRSSPTMRPSSPGEYSSFGPHPEGQKPKPDAAGILSFCEYLPASRTAA